MRRFFRDFDWQYWMSRWILMTAGSVISALSIDLFFVPSNFAPAGVSGISMILNNLIGVPVGLTIMVLNIPVLLIGFRMLTGWRTVAETIYFVVTYSLLIDLLAPFLPDNGISDDLILNALFGGIVGGFAGGLVYRAGGTMGGTSVFSRILQQKFGMPLSTSTLYTDTAIIFAAGLTFGWEAALYSTLALFIGSVASDYVLEGASDSSTALIITDDTEGVITVLKDKLERGMTYWEGKGAYRHAPRGVIMVTVSRSEVNMLRKILSIIDPDVFVTILKGQYTYGRGFRSIHPAMPLKLDVQDDSLTGKFSTQEIRMIQEADTRSIDE